MTTHRWMLLPLLAAAGLAQAATFTLTPVRLPDGTTLAGSISTDGSTGPLTAANLTGWDVTLTRVSRITYDPTHPGGPWVSGVSVTPDGLRMSVKASPDGVRDGGLLAFGSFGPGPEYGVQVANHTGPYAAGGVAFYLAGPAFEWQWLNVPDGARRVVAKATAPGVFKLVPVTFPSGTVMSGSLRTDGRTGVLSAANLLDWKITASQTSVTRYTPANSTLLPASVGLDSDGTTLSVARPGGYLGFGVAPRPPARGQGAVLADFSPAAPTGGQAGYFNAFDLQYQPLKFKGTAYPVATVQP